MKEYAEPFYKSMAWKRTSEAYRKSVGGMCEVCWSKGIARAGEIVHHKVHISPENINDTNITLNWNNLQLVCRECHAKAHSRKQLRYTFDEYGRIIPHDTPL